MPNAGYRLCSRQFTVLKKKWIPNTNIYRGNERFVRALASEVREIIALALGLPSSLRSLPVMQGLFPIRALFTESLASGFGRQRFMIIPTGLYDCHLLNCC